VVVYAKEDYQIRTYHISSSIIMYHYHRSSYIYLQALSEDDQKSNKIREDSQSHSFFLFNTLQLETSDWRPLSATFSATFSASSQVKMMFDWRLQFNWLDDGTDLVPCMSGGLFAITQPGQLEEVVL